MTKPNLKSRQRVPLIALVVALAAIVGAAALVLSNAVIDIPKPGGPHAVGFRSTTLLDPARTMAVHGQTRPRVITLDTWYPATNTAGLIAEPYQDKLLAQLLAQHQGIPDMGASGPSYAFVDASALPGKHPVVIFNHGYGSFTKQNFSNMQELASHGYLVISIGHPAESLVAKDADGGVIEFDPNTPQYVEYSRVQKDTKAYAETLSAILARQRAAGDAAAHQRASQELASVQPFVGLQPMVDAWARDTRHVIDALSSMPEADSARVTLMGHSLGGVVSLDIAKNPPPGVIGVINLDGPWVRYGQDTRPLRVPLLALLSTDNVLEGQDIGMHGTFDGALKAGEKPAHVIEIAGAAHNNFTDLTYVQLLKYITPILGSVDAHAVTRWQNEAMLAFLRGLETGVMPAALLAPDARVQQRHFGFE